MAALPNGDIVVLLKRGSPALVRIDQQTRGHELPVPADVDPGDGTASWQRRTARCCSATAAASFGVNSTAAS